MSNLTCIRGRVLYWLLRTLLQQNVCEEAGDWPEKCIHARAGLISLYTLWQLCILHEHDGKRFNRYHELAQVMSHDTFCAVSG